MADFLIGTGRTGSHWGGMNDVRRRRNAPIHSERHVKIIVIGAGASGMRKPLFRLHRSTSYQYSILTNMAGLLFAYKLQRSFRNYNLTIYEKNKEISGTWWENK
jgi:hypothetical protein